MTVSDKPAGNARVRRTGTAQHAARDRPTLRRDGVVIGSGTHRSPTRCNARSRSRRDVSDALADPVAGTASPRGKGTPSQNAAVSSHRIGRCARGPRCNRGVVSARSRLERTATARRPSDPAAARERATGRRHGSSGPEIPTVEATRVEPVREGIARAMHEPGGGPRAPHHPNIYQSTNSGPLPRRRKPTDTAPKPRPRT